MAKTNVVLDAGTCEAIQRQLSTLKSITTEIARMRIEVEAKKLAAKETMTDIESGTLNSTQSWEKQITKCPKYGNGSMNEISRQRYLLKRRS